MVINKIIIVRCRDKFTCSDIPDYSLIPHLATFTDGKITSCEPVLFELISITINDLCSFAQDLNKAVEDVLTERSKIYEESELPDFYS